MVIRSMRYVTLILLSITGFFSGLTFSEPSEMAAEISTESEIGYISDQFYVPLRSSPCSTCKIVHKGLKSGTRLFVYELSLIHI